MVYKLFIRNFVLPKINQLSPFPNPSMSKRPFAVTKWVFWGGESGFWGDDFCCFLVAFEWFCISFVRIMVKVTAFKCAVFLALSFLVLRGGQSHAQSVNHYSTSDGLAHKHVTAMYQDSKGYLWVGTWDGLSKFDGENFTTFHHSPEDSTSIFGNQISMITEDSSGNVWAVSRKGIMRYSERENVFSRVYLRDYYKGSLKYPLGSGKIAFDNSGKGWFVDQFGLLSFSNDLKKIHTIDISEIKRKNEDYRNTIFTDNKGLWLATGMGLFHFNYSYLNETDSLHLSESDCVYPFQDNINPDFDAQYFSASNGDIIVRNSTHSICIADKDSGILQAIVLPLVEGRLIKYQYVSILAEIDPGKLALKTNNYGILIYNLNTRQFEFDHPIQTFTGRKATNAVYRDSQHNIWLGGLDGLHKITEDQLNFDSWLYDADNENSIMGTSINTVYLEHNHLWLASSGGGVDRINLSTNQTTHLELPEKFHGLSQGVNAFVIFGLDSSRLLINYDSVLFMYHISSNRFSHVGTVHYHVYKIYQDHEGDIWISDNKRLYFLEPGNDSLVLSSKYRLGDQFRDMILTKTGAAFLATGYGLVKFDKKRFEAVKTHVPPGSETFPEVFCIHQTSEGLLWLGTIHHGIYCFDPQSEQFIRHYDNRDGLIDNSVNAIFGDNQGYLWMSTWKGIARFDPHSETFSNYSTANGLPFPEFNTGAYFEDEAGNYYFGGIGGVIRFHPDSFVNFDFDFTPQITAIIGNNQLIEMDYPLRGNELINIPYDKSSLDIIFKSFDFRNPNQRIYRYRIQGLDQDWKNTGGNNKFARYHALNPGDYSFELQSTYKGWDWDDKPVKYTIRVQKPPIFQRQSFRTFLFSLLGLLLLSLVFLRLRNRNLRKEIIIANLEREANKSRLNYLKSQMNPHFYFNTLNAINSFILNNDTRSANKYLTKFARLMRETLENSQKEFITIEEEKKMLENYLFLQQLRFPTAFDFSITAEDQVKSKSIPPMLIQPFVENAVGHAFAGMIAKGNLELRFALQNENILCSVIDNGIGIENSTAHKTVNSKKSTAIKNIRQRIDMLNKVYNTSIQLEITPADKTNIQFPGTRVTVILPLSIYLSDKS